MHTCNMPVIFTCVYNYLNSYIYKIYVCVCCVYLFVCLLACLFVCLFVCLLVCSFVRSFVRFFVRSFVPDPPAAAAAAAAEYFCFSRKSAEKIWLNRKAATKIISASQPKFSD